MTKAEEKSIERVYEMVRELKEINSNFQKKSEERVAAVEAQVKATYLPVNLEQEVLRTAQISIAKAIEAAFTGYSNPLVQFVGMVVNENAAFLKGVISDSFNEVIRTEDFKKAIVNAFSHKVVRSIISNNDRLFDKISNDLKQDTIFKSKMALAVANVVEECLKEKRISGAATYKG